MKNMGALESCKSLCGVGHAFFLESGQTQQTPTQNRHKNHTCILRLCSYVFIQILCQLKSFHSQAKLRNLRFFALIAGNCGRTGGGSRKNRGRTGAWASSTWHAQHKNGGEPGALGENGGEPGALRENRGEPRVGI